MEEKMNLLTLTKNIKNSKLVKNISIYYKKNDIKIKLILLVVICSGMIIRGIMQQPQIIENKAEIAKLNEQIEYEHDRQTEVENLNDIVDTDEYIEKIAREKLGMIKADERIFIDVSKSQND